MKKSIFTLWVAGFYLTAYSQSAAEYSATGIEKINTNDYSGAIEDFTKAIALEPANDNSFYNRGIARYYQKDYPGAIVDYTKAIELAPQREYYHNRGIVKYRLKDHKGAIEDYTKAIELSPDDADDFHARANARYDTQDFSGAIDDYSKALVLDAEFGGAYYKRGMAKIISGAKEDGCLDLEKAADLGIALASDGMLKLCK